MYAYSIDGSRYDPELIPGARNAIETCLALRPGERLTLITDLATMEIAASLQDAAVRVGGWVERFVLEEEAPRPQLHCPTRILDAVEHSDAVLSCFQPVEGEISSRAELIHTIELRQVRYAHMVWISHTIMCQSMRADYRRVDRISDWLLDQVRPAHTVTVTSPAGTNIEATFDLNHRWFKTSGLIDPAVWSNLPGGEVWCAPGNVEGTFVVDGAVGDYLCPKYGDVSGAPLVLEIENNRLVGAHGENAALVAEFLQYCSREANGDRIGEFAFGTNIGITQMIGNLLQDEKVPGVHIAFGNPLPNLTGVDWTCGTHIDAISRGTNVWVDGMQIMAAGRYLVTI